MDKNKELVDRPVDSETVPATVKDEVHDVLQPGQLRFWVRLNRLLTVSALSINAPLFLWLLIYSVLIAPLSWPAALLLFLTGAATTLLSCYWIHHSPKCIVKKLKATTDPSQLRHLLGILNAQKSIEDRVEVADGYRRLGKTYLDNGEYAEAEVLYAQAYQLSAHVRYKIADDYSTLGKTFLAKGNLFDADIFITKGQEFYPDQAYTIAQDYFQLGASHLKKGAITEAEILFTLAVKSHRNMREWISDSYLEQGKILLELGKHEEARDHLIKQQEYSSTDGRSVVGAVLLVRAMRALGKNSQIPVILRKALTTARTTQEIACQPHTARCLEELGMYYLELGLYSEATPLLSKACQEYDARNLREEWLRTTYHLLQCFSSTHDMAAHQSTLVLYQARTSGTPVRSKAIDYFGFAGCELELAKHLLAERDNSTALERLQSSCQLLVAEIANCGRITNCDLERQKTLDSLLQFFLTITPEKLHSTTQGLLISVKETYELRVMLQLDCELLKSIYEKVTTLLKSVIPTLLTDAGKR